MLAALLLLAGCGEMRTAEHHYFLRHTVQPGETLYSIAWRFGYDYREVAAWNRITPPYRIYVGEQLMLMAPDRYQPLPRGGSSGAEAKRDTSHAPAPRRPSGKRSPAPTEREPAEEGEKMQWQWPTEGKVVARFAAMKGRKGVDVGGRVGQPVRAAAGGEVVYSGKGLIGYGNLVIVKHNETYLSAYGHNRKLLVKEGEKVKAGQPIGEMGQTPKGQTILHFEIRRNGNPVDPLLYFPNQLSS